MRMIGTFNHAKSKMLEYIKDDVNFIRYTGECITYKKSKEEIEKYLHNKYGNKINC